MSTIPHINEYSVLVQFQTYRLEFQQKLMKLILGNHFALYSRDRM